MKRLLTYGTFDLFHHGHLRLFQRCSLLADEIYVGVSTDCFNLEKGKHSVQCFERRCEEVLKPGLITATFAEESFDQKKADIKRFNATLLVMGDDWKGKFDALSKYCEVLYLPRTPEISTTLLKAKMNWRGNGA